MQNGKSAECDGLPSEFFNFANQLAPILLSVFEELFITVSLPLTMRQAVISLIPEKDKNPLECSADCPVSLNVDGKILSKMLACCLEAVLTSVTSDGLTGLIRSCHSFLNTQYLHNTLNDPTPPDILEMSISLDAKKAFDQVE